MKESYRKGVANHLALRSAAPVVRPAPKREPEESVGRVLSFEKDIRDADPVDRGGRPHRDGRNFASPARVPRSRRPLAR